MKTIMAILGLLAFSCNCFAAGQQEVLIDIPAAVFHTSRLSAAESMPDSSDHRLDWVYMESTASTSNLNAPDSKTSPVSARELLNKVSIGAWKWDNGTYLRVSGDRLRMSYGEKTRVNLTVRPFRDEDTVTLVITRNF